MNSSVIFLDGCSLNTEFISAIFAALLLASALVGQFCKMDEKIIGGKMCFYVQLQEFEKLLLGARKIFRARHMFITLNSKEHDTFSQV